MATQPDEGRRPVRYIKPLGPRVLVRIIRLEERSAAGLYLPEGVREEHDDACYGEVVEVARVDSKEDASLGENVSGVPLGALILFPKDTGLTVPWDDSRRRLDVKRVMAIVEELEQDELQ